MISEAENLDCMIGMSRYPDKYFELAIVDPPYGLGKSVVNSGGRFKRYTNKNGNWDLQIPPKDYFDGLFRISKEQIIFGGNYFSLPSNKCFIVWDKGQPEDISFAMCEYAWSSLNSVAQIYKKRTQDQDGRFHPTQKPIDLYSWILRKYAKQGDKILDTHLGSGSIAIACYDMGFDLTGYEIDKDYYDAAVKRLENHKKQLTIF